VALLGAALERGLIADTAVATSIEQANAMWHLRESIPLAQSAEGANVKHDIALPISAIDGFVAATDAALLRAFPGVRLVDFGHLGDGNLHYNVQGPSGGEGDEFVARHEASINRVVYDAVVARGGSFSAEHGIGALKRDELVARKSPVALDMMRAIKIALDPAGVLNPGRVLSPAARP
jgi:FAD/FMN-containing dehydrogenase